jgi:GNAT superfamily N-acetyltransferase
VIRPAQPQDYPRLADFCAQVHAQPVALFAALLGRYPAACHWLWEEAGDLVAMGSLLPQTLWIAGYPLVSAEVGLIGTAPAHRGKGLARQIINHLLIQTQHQQIPLLWLAGDPDFYQRWGFAAAMPGPAGRIHLPVAQIPLGSSQAFRVRRLQPKDLPHVMALYQASVQQAGAQQRTLADWERLLTLLNTASHSAWVSLSLSGQVAAYLWLHQGRELEGLEGMASTPEAAAALLQAVRPELRRQAVLRLNLPPGPFQEACWQWGAAGQSPRHVYPGTWAALARIGHWISFWQGLAPLFTGRLQNSPWAGRSGQWQWRCEAETVAVNWDGQALHCAAVAYDHAAFCESPARWAAWATGWLTCDGPDPLPWLFGGVTPWMSALDAPEELAYGHPPGAQ